MGAILYFVTYVKWQSPAAAPETKRIETTGVLNRGDWYAKMEGTIESSPRHWSASALAQTTRSASKLGQAAPPQAGRNCREPGGGEAGGRARGPAKVPGPTNNNTATNHTPASWEQVGLGGLRERELL